MKSAILFLTALVATPTFAEAPDIYAEVTDLVEAARNEWRAPGMSVAVAANVQDAGDRRALGLKIAELVLGH